MNITLGNFVQRHAQAIATKNNVTLVYLVKNTDLANAYEIEETTINGVREIICYYKKKGIFGSGYLNAFNNVVDSHLRNQIQQFDLVHVNVLFKAGWLAYQLHKKYNLPYIITEHWTGYHLENRSSIGRLERFLSRRIARKASLIVPVSDHLASSMKSFGLSTNYRVIPNVVDHNLFKISPEKKDTYTFIHVSSLVDNHKNVSGIIRAFNEIYQKIDANLFIVGDGDIKPYEKLAHDLQIPSSRITFKGAQPLASIAKMVSACHCLILFSFYENQPCVIPEAHAAGLPVIATKVGGIAEHLSKKHGILINSNDEKALSKAMTNTFSNSVFYDDEWLRNYAINHFSVEAIANAYSELYHEVI